MQNLEYSSTYNFLLPIPVSDWLIFYCGIVILTKKWNENDKNTNFLMKNIKVPKSVCNMHQTLERRINLADKKLSVEHTPRET